jgi:hypothetical protein
MVRKVIVPPGRALSHALCSYLCLLSFLSLDVPICSFHFFVIYNVISGLVALIGLSSMTLLGRAPSHKTALFVEHLGRAPPHKIASQVAFLLSRPGFMVRKVIVPHGRALSHALCVYLYLLSVLFLKLSIF